MVLPPTVPVAVAKQVLAPRVAPYVWRSNMLRKDLVYGDTGKMKVQDIDEMGKVMVVDRYRVTSLAPKRMAFESCPSCMKSHSGLSRRCGECGESMVYYPRPKESRVLRQPAVRKSVNSHRIYKTLSNENALQGVKSSLSYYLYQTYHFRDAADLHLSEEVIKNYLTSKFSNLTDPETYLLKPEAHIGVFPTNKKGDEHDLQIILTSILAVAADRGNKRWAHEIMDMKKYNSAETLYDAKLLKDCFSNTMYLRQSLMSDV